MPKVGWLGAVYFTLSLNLSEIASFDHGAKISLVLVTSAGFYQSATIFLHLFFQLKVSAHIASLQSLRCVVFHSPHYLGNETGSRNEDHRYMQHTCMCIIHTCIIVKDRR